MKDSIVPALILSAVTLFLVWGVYSQSQACFDEKQAMVQRFGPTGGNNLLCTSEFPLFALPPLAWLALPALVFVVVFFDLLNFLNLLKGKEAGYAKDEPIYCIPVPRNLSDFTINKGDYLGPFYLLRFSAKKNCKGERFRGGEPLEKLSSKAFQKKEKARYAVSDELISIDDVLAYAIEKGHLGSPFEVYKPYIWLEIHFARPKNPDEAIADLAARDEPEAVRAFASTRPEQPQRRY